MAIDLNDEIVQDFLVEAQELIENLDSQLIDLEHAPDDHGLLNAVFRGFHTIKGGAGFLALEALVELAREGVHIRIECFQYNEQAARLAAVLPHSAMMAVIAAVLMS